MIARARTYSVVLVVLCGALGLISSTQTWLNVTLSESGADALAVSGADASAVLAPLSLAVLALGGALSVAGTVLRYVFGALATVIALTQAALAGYIVIARPLTAVARSVTDATGITGRDPIAALVSAVHPTAWPALTWAIWIVLIATGVFILVTARRWGHGSHRYRADSHAAAPATGPLDAVDSWDDLSRGDDPTSGTQAPLD